MTERGKVVADHSPRPLVQHDAPVPHAALADTVAAFEERARDRDFADDVAIGPKDLADGPSEEFGDAIADLRASDDEHAVAVAAVFEEVGFEKGDFSGREGTGRHDKQLRCGSPPNSI